MDIRFLVDNFWLSILWNIWSHSLWGPIVSEERSIDILTGFSSMWWVIFFCGFQDFSLSLSTFKLRCLWVWISLYLSYLEFIEILWCGSIFHQIWEVFCHYFFDYLFWSYLSLLSFWSCHYTYVDACSSILCFSEALLIYLHSFSLFFRLNNIYLSIKFADYSASSNLLLNPSNELFFSVILFNFSISIWFFLMISIPSFIFSIW